MFWHNLKIGWRNILKYRLQSLICMIGLALGLSCFAWCSQLLRERLNWNRNLPYIERTCFLSYVGEDQKQYILNSPSLNQMIGSGFPEIEKAVAYFTLSGYTDKMREQVGPYTDLEIQNLLESTREIDFELRMVEFLVFLFSLICIVISLLGVYSSMALVVEKRKKEMAIRKINGASAKDIAVIFNKQYAGLLLGAVVFAFPCLWLGVKYWLEGYEYHITLSVGPFIVIGGIMWGIIRMTIGSQLKQVMRVQPAETVKEE